MLPIILSDEPEEFNEKVRKKGKNYLKRVKNPTTKQWKTHSYWLNVKNDLRDAFKSVCAYSCHWVSDDTGWATCDHYIDKFSEPNLAYEWTNYRFVCGVLNGRKKNESIIDPVNMMAGTFIIDFPSLLVKPSDSLEESEYKHAISTINILGLNSESTCLKSRFTHLMEYSNNCINDDYLSRHAPFIFSELTRQHLLTSIKSIMLMGQVEPPHCSSQ